MISRKDDLVMRIRTADKPWNKRRFLRTLTAALAFGVFMPVQVSAEEVAAATEPADETLVEGQTNEFTSSYLELVDSFTTAERIPSSRFDTPANVIVITAAEIEANHYQDLAEAISHVNGAFASHWVLNGSEKVVILVNGHRASFAPMMEAVERIEILKGGASALYGSEAVGGVINIITKKGTFNETTLDFNTGSWHQHNYKLTNQGNAGNFSWFLGGGIYKAHPFHYNGSEVINYHEVGSDKNDNTAYLRLDNRFDDASSLAFEFQHTTNKNNNYGQWKGTYEELTGTSLPAYYDFGNEFSLTYNFKEDTDTPGFLRYFNNYNESSSYYSFYNETKLQGIDYQNGWTLGEKHRIIVGLEWHRLNWNHEKNVVHAQVPSRDEKITDTAAYVQDTIAIDDKWTFVPGIRLDHNSNFGNQWSPKAAVNYRADDKTKIYASVGRVYRAPSPIELYSRDILFELSRYSDADELGYSVYDLGGYYWLGRITRGNSSLKPETGHTESIGFEHDFDDYTNISVNLFQNSVKDSLDTYITGDLELADETLFDLEVYTGGSEYINAGSEKHRGIDIAFRHEINDHWDYNLGYVHTHNERQQLSGALASHNIIPQNSYRLGLRYSNRDFKATLLGIMGTGMDEDFFASSNYAVLDLNTSYNLTDWSTVYLKLTNFTNENYSYAGKNFRSPGRSFLVGAQFKF